MGLAWDSVKDALSYIFKTREFLVLVLVLGVLQVPQVFLTGIPAIVYSVFTIIASFVSTVIVLSLLKTGSLSKALSVFPKYLVDVLLVSLALLFLYAVMMAVYLVFVFIISLFFGSGIVFIILFALLSIPVLGAFLYASARLSLSTVVLVLEDAGVEASIRRAWKVSEGKVLSIFAATFTLGILYAVPIIALSIITVFFALATPGGAIYPLLHIVMSFLQSMYSLSNTVLCVFLLKNILKGK